MEQRNPEYRLQKVTFETRICATCKGTKLRTVNLGNHQHKTVSCSTCAGTGVYTYEKPMPISLSQALNEMGIYTMIKNTVEEILTQTTNENNSN